MVKINIQHFINAVLCKFPDVCAEGTFKIATTLLFPNCKWPNILTKFELSKWLCILFSEDDNSIQNIQSE